MCCWKKLLCEHLLKVHGPLVIYEESRHCIICLCTTDSMALHSEYTGKLLSHDYQTELFTKVLNFLYIVTYDFKMHTSISVTPCKTSDDVIYENSQHIITVLGIMASRILVNFLSGSALAVHDSLASNVTWDICLPVCKNSTILSFTKNSFASFLSETFREFHLLTAPLSCMYFHLKEKFCRWHPRWWHHLEPRRWWEILRTLSVPIRVGELFFPLTKTSTSCRFLLEIGAECGSVYK